MPSLDKKTVALIVSLILNLLGGAGIIPPVAGDDCPPALTVEPAGAQ